MTPMTMPTGTFSAPAATATSGRGNPRVSTAGARLVEWISYHSRASKRT
jgi:hypothetical protein